MGSAQEKAVLLRIERGQATEEELAAVAVTLLSRAAGQAESREEDGSDLPAADWHRYEQAGHYRAPHSWR